VRVDGKADGVRRFAGIYPAVPIDAGSHVVEFRYVSPATIAGIIASLAAAVLIAVLAAQPAVGLRSWWVGLVAVALATFFGLSAYRHMYGGPSMGTRCTWSFPP
jgi:hypothetical protein